MKTWHRAKKKEIHAYLVEVSENQQHSERYFYMSFITLSNKKNALSREKAKTVSPIQSTNLSFTESFAKQANR